METDMNYEPIIGLEIHIELATKSKMFCGCKNDPFFAPHPNIYTCPVCLGMPGGLPVPNKKAIEWCMMLGLALGCEIATESKFDRKNYFYPDLPKGYQITQYDKPFAENGNIEINGKSIRVRRVHMEEDTGKLLHETVDGKRVSLVDFNRSGVPLVEIVTEPDFHSIGDVDAYVKKLQQIVRYLGISGADLEKGSMRIEPSVSIRGIASQPERSRNDTFPKYRVEIKNINSFRFVRKALEAEIERQIQNPNDQYQATFRYDEKTNTTIPMRSKEQAEDYRYFPEPDIPSIQLSRIEIREIESQIPELPDKKKERFVKNFGIKDSDAALLTESIYLANYFEEAVLVGKEVNVEPKRIANWIVNKKPDIVSVLPAQLVEEIKVAHEVVELLEEDALLIIHSVIKKEEKAVSDYRNGKEAAIMFLFGQVNRELKGKGDKKTILDLLRKELQDNA